MEPLIPVPVFAALVAASAAVLGYLLNARINRLREREKYFAAALLATEQYKQLAYWLQRVDDPQEKAKKIAEVHENLAYHRRWLRLNCPAVSAHYRTLVIHLRNKEFFRPDRPAITDDDKSKIELENQHHSGTGVWRKACIEAMDHELSIFKIWSPGRPEGEPPKLFSRMSEEDLVVARAFYYPESSLSNK